jgi:phosphatidylcholine synthase
MDQFVTPNSAAPTPAARTAAFCVHVLTALGAGLALLALLEAVREHWAAMFGWLGLALVVDAIDGPLARRFEVTRLQPRWSGETLDLVVDFVTYVFVPAYAIVASRLLPPVVGGALGVGIVMTSALYFADREMKTDDNHFRGFPGLWNAAAFYLFLLQPSPAIATITVTLLIALTFVPLRVVHPVRVERHRMLTVGLVAVWAGLAVAALVYSFDVGWTAKIVLCAIALYIVCADAFLRILRPATP